MARIVILGCGYVGLELGRRLVGDCHRVVGVRRSDEGLAAVAAAGLSPARADVTDAGDLAGLPDADALVFAASAGGRGASAARGTYVRGLRAVVDEYGSRSDPPDRLVYTSSTGVYGDHGGDWVDEGTPVDPRTERAAALVEAERVARRGAADAGIDPTVVRFAGLYGPGRYRLERYLEGPVTAGYLNLLHRADAAGTVAFALGTDRLRNELVVAVDDEPVDRRDLADWLADECGVERPRKRSRADAAAGDASPRVLADKRCSNAYLRSLGYEFRFPTYREGYRDAIRSYSPEGGQSTGS